MNWWLCVDRRIRTAGAGATCVMEVGPTVLLGLATSLDLSFGVPQKSPTKDREEPATSPMAHVDCAKEPILRPLQSLLRIVHSQPSLVAPEGAM